MAKSGDEAEGKAGEKKSVKIKDLKKRIKRKRKRKAKLLKKAKQ
jgi:hypothetical protein